MGKRIYLESRAEPAVFTLLGISCHLRDYRLSYLINQHQGFSFVKREDLRIANTSSREEAEFSFYLYRNEERQQTWYLIGNRSQDFVLVPEMKQFDFLLVVEGKCNKPEKELLMKAIRSLPGVLTIFEIQFAEIKNYESLLTDVEMHLMNIQKKPKLKYQPK